jgi:hypothetical protein
MIPDKSTTGNMLASISRSSSTRIILTRQIKWKVDASQHNSHQNVPTKQTRDKAKCASRLLTLRCDRSMSFCEIEERASEETECGDEREEDEEEDKVRADGADEVNEAENSHADHKIA